jgi:hypothetical protein
VCATRVGSETFEIVPSKELLDKLLDYPGFLASLNAAGEGGGLETRHI